MHQREERGQIGDHENEDQQGNEAGFPGEAGSEPPGPDEKPADEQANNADGAKQGKDSREVEIEAADGADGVEEAQAEQSGAVVQGNQGEGAKSPENECVRKTRKGASTDDPGLAQNLPDELPECLPRGDR